MNAIRTIDMIKLTETTEKVKKSEVIYIKDQLKKHHQESIR